MSEENFDIRNEALLDRDNELDREIRPTSFVDFKGQDRIISNYFLSNL